MKTKIHLLIIDPQNDFCDVPAGFESASQVSHAQHQAALPVQGASADMQRIADLIRQRANEIDAITVTQDAHQRMDIAHADFWMDGSGHAVPAFTQITHADVQQGKWVPRDPNALERALTYLAQLEQQTAYRHTLWPDTLRKRQLGTRGAS